MKKLTIVFLLISGIFAYSCSTSKTAQKTVAAKNVSFETGVFPILTKHCTKCHSDFSDKEIAAGNMDTMISLIEKGIMPPNDEKPSKEEINILKAWDRVK